MDYLKIGEILIEGQKIKLMEDTIIQIGDNYKFSNCFNLTTYNIIRKRFDPDNIFISKFN